MKKYTYEIESTGEPDAGYIPYRDTITVTVDSGDPGGEGNEFGDFMAGCLAEWYEGADIFYYRALLQKVTCCRHARPLDKVTIL